jgi:hypothetical protein
MLFGMLSDRYSSLFEGSPALRLFRKRSGTFLCSFLFDVFKDGGRIEVAEDVLELLLDERVDLLREVEESDAPRKEAREYLNDWCGDDFRCLRREFSEKLREYIYKLTPDAEKALSFLEELRAGQRQGYTTAQSRFKNILEGLRELSREANPDPEQHIVELIDQRKKIDEIIRGIRETGTAPTLEPGEVKDRLLDLDRTVEQFVADFRAIEENFKEQARALQQKFSEGGQTKGDVLEQALDAEDNLRRSDQGRSYFGFSAMMACPEDRKDLRACARKAAELSAELKIPADAFEGLAGRLIEEESIVQNAYSRISRQLKRVVEDFQASEARRVKALLDDIRKLAIQVADNPPPDADWPIQIEMSPRVGNFMEVQFYKHRGEKPFATIEGANADENDWASEALRGLGKPLDLKRFRNRVEAELKQKPQISLRELLELYPPEDGVVDLIAYHAIAGENERHRIDDGVIKHHDLNRPSQPRYAASACILFQKK